MWDRTDLPQNLAKLQVKVVRFGPEPPSPRGSLVPAVLVVGALVTLTLKFLADLPI